MQLSEGGLIILGLVLGFFTGWFQSSIVVFCEDVHDYIRKKKNKNKNMGE